LVGASGVRGAHQGQGDGGAGKTSHCWIVVPFSSGPHDGKMLRRGVSPMTFLSADGRNASTPPKEAKL
jgi:hypothetical protein